MKTKVKANDFCANYNMYPFWHEFYYMNVSWRKACLL